ncbi:hypothetical protein E2C01_096610 [Portunus trituberculatus]|uniref:Uncharacterized protein n=1 Tax=Portunus trituberculatus TaxID=210409 RepID=A0A5B7K7A7_PORTR|nr:hypothetical protein [Portunus trituberculatus]
MYHLPLLIHFHFTAEAST